LLIFRQSARIGGVVLARSELQRIDEYARHHAIAAITRRREQTHMTGMQIAHRWHERDREERVTPFLNAFANGGDRGDSFHASVLHRVVCRIGL
jgi:hypothetical protein